MGLFGNDDENEDEDVEEVDAPDLEAPDAEDSSADHEESPDEADLEQDTEGEQASDDQAPSVEPEDNSTRTVETEEGDEVEVEEALKELSARMSVLSSNLEGVQESRGDLEEKIGDVEERMSRLGSLAEAVSSEYNPFISENAPNEPSWDPDSDGSQGDGLPLESESPQAEEAAPPEAAEALAEQDVENADPTDMESNLDEVPNEPEVEPVEEIHPEEVQPESEPEHEAGEPEPAEPEQADESAPEPDTGVPRGEPDQAEESPIPRTDPDRLDPSRNNGSQPGGGDQLSQEASDEFEENMLMLEWVGVMLDRVGRAGLLDLLDYYQNLGWLDPQTKDRVTRVAVGVEAPDHVDEGHWRGDVDLHRKSLVAIQRLQGEEIPAARVDELELDLRRLFRE